MTQASDQAIIAAGQDVLREGAGCLERAAAGLGADFAAAARALADRASFTMIAGVGKSGAIGRKFAASLLSTGHGAAFVHPTDALHGDIGIADHATLAVLLSHSGNAEELIRLVPVLKQFAVKAVLITRRRDCALAPFADWIVESGVNEEAGIGRLAPTSSSTTALALCDALMMASLGLRGFSRETFDRYHPGGVLGRQLRTVADVMLPLDRLPVVAPDADLTAVAAAITDGGLGFCIVADAPPPTVEATGFVSDGDVRRTLVRHGFEGRAADIMTLGARAIAANALTVEALRLMEQHAITTLLCHDGAGGLVGAVHIHGLVARELGLEPARGQAGR